MTMAADLRPRLLAFINEEVVLDQTQEVAGPTDLLLTGLVDSLGVLDVVAWLEEDLRVEIDPVDIVLENFQTVDLMLAFAESLERS